MKLSSQQQQQPSPSTSSAAIMDATPKAAKATLQRPMRAPAKAAQRRGEVVQPRRSQRCLAMAMKAEKKTKKIEGPKATMIGAQANEAMIPASKRRVTDARFNMDNYQGTAFGGRIASIRERLVKLQNNANAKPRAVQMCQRALDAEEEKFNEWTNNQSQFLDSFGSLSDDDDDDVDNWHDAEDVAIVYESLNVDADDNDVKHVLPEIPENHFTPIPGGPAVNLSYLQYETLNLLEIRVAVSAQKLREAQAQAVPDARVVQRVKSKLEAHQEKLLEFRNFNEQCIASQWSESSDDEEENCGSGPHHQDTVADGHGEEHGPHHQDTVADGHGEEHGPHHQDTVADGHGEEHGPHHQDTVADGHGEEHGPHHQDTVADGHGEEHGPHHQDTVTDGHGEEHGPHHQDTVADGHGEEHGPHHQDTVADGHGEEHGPHHQDTVADGHGEEHGPHHQDTVADGHGEEHGPHHQDTVADGHGEEHGPHHQDTVADGHGEEHGPHHQDTVADGHGEEHGPHHQDTVADGHGEEHGPHHQDTVADGHGEEHRQRLTKEDIRHMLEEDEEEDSLSVQLRELQVLMSRYNTKVEYRNSIVEQVNNLDADLDVMKKQIELKKQQIEEQEIMESVSDSGVVESDEVEEWQAQVVPDPTATRKRRRDSENEDDATLPKQLRLGTNLYFHKRKYTRKNTQSFGGHRIKPPKKSITRGPTNEKSLGVQQPTIVKVQYQASGSVNRRVSEPRRAENHLPSNQVLQRASGRRNHRPVKKQPTPSVTGSRGVDMEMTQEPTAPAYNTRARKRAAAAMEEAEEAASNQSTPNNILVNPARGNKRTRLEDGDKKRSVSQNLRRSSRRC